MPIVPLPVFEAEADPRTRSAMSDEEIYARLEPPKTIVVRFGSLKYVGEFTYDGSAKPGCGSKLVARTQRGTELAEMLTTTCPNSGCSKSVSRQEMLEYIENSGGKDYPFHTNGRIIRVATVEDLNRNSELTTTYKQEAVRVAKQMVQESGLPMKLVDAEPILGGELLTFFYMSEDRVDFRDLVKNLAAHFGTRIEMRQVGARDEARLVADYEKCGQYCCCKNFLKLLQPISMRLAKEQKATLDPLKISGRCGRLMCCLRYEDATYTELKAKLPKKGKRVGTSSGPGVVVEGKILVQLVLVRLEHDNSEIAVPVEELMSPEECPPPGTKPSQGGDFGDGDPLRGISAQEVSDRINPEKRTRRRQDDRSQPRTKDQQQAAYREKTQNEGRDKTGDVKPQEERGHDRRGRGRDRNRGRGRGRDRGQIPGGAPHQGRGDRPRQPRPPAPTPSPDLVNEDLIDEISEVGDLTDSSNGSSSSAPGAGTGPGGPEGQSGGRRRRRRRGRRGGRGSHRPQSGSDGNPPPSAGGGGGGGQE